MSLQAWRTWRGVLTPAHFSTCCTIWSLLVLSQLVLLVLHVSAGMENLARCPDTRTFVGMLHHLEDPDDEDADPPELPEKLAAKNLFYLEASVPNCTVALAQSACLAGNAG